MPAIGDQVMFRSGFNEPDYPAAVTAVHDDGSINLEALDAQVRHGGHYVEMDVEVLAVAEPRRCAYAA